MLRLDAMKIILSRKGFDSTAGGVASPILPPDELYSLPIPETKPIKNPVRYEDIVAGSESMGKLVRDLTGGKRRPNEAAHLDPDLDACAVLRREGWKPLFGQAGAAETHLQNSGVNEGDMFLFYGWFRHAKKVHGKYSFVPNAPDLHVIFGWLQIEKRIPVDPPDDIPLWAMKHPHCVPPKYRKNDCIYIATDHLALPAITIDRPGAGIFRRFRKTLCLTDCQQPCRSIWRLHPWFHPAGKTSGLTYNGKPDRWERRDDYVRLKTMSPGQEFILDCTHYPESIEWLAQILECSD